MIIEHTGEGMTVRRKTDSPVEWLWSTDGHIYKRTTMLPQWQQCNRATVPFDILGAFANHARAASRSPNAS